MPKKAPKNALHFFMKDVQAELREGGKTLPMKDIAEIACPRFKLLPREEKLRYQKMEEEYKKERKESNVDRYSSDGIPLALLLEQEREMKEIETMMNEKVESFVFDNAKEILATSIYVISFNVLVATREDDFLPNELAIVEYSLMKGLKGSYHAFINPGKIPIGYFSAAKDHSEETHKIPVSMDEIEDGLNGEIVHNDYGLILNQIFTFTKARGRETIVFTHESQMEQVQGCFKWLLKYARMQGNHDNFNTNNIVFADIAQLVIHLHTLIGSPLATRTIADDLLLQNMFDYAVRTRCPYHEDLDSCYCALGFARKMCFILSDAFVKVFGLELTKAHLPEREGDVLIEVEPKSNPNAPSLGGQLICEDESQEIENSFQTKGIENNQDLDEDDDDDLSDPEVKGATGNTEISDKDDFSLPPRVLVDQEEVAVMRGVGRGRGRGIMFI